MTLNSKIVILALVILIMGSLAMVNRESFLTEWKIENLTKEVFSNKREVKKVVYIINTGDRQLFYQVSPKENSTVFSLLQELSGKEEFLIKYTLYPEMGVLVENIDGYGNGKDNKYWQYWVNDKLSMVAADKKEVREGEKVEWRFELSPF